MKQVHHPFFFLTLPLATLGSFTYFTVATAQITPDNSLGAESSVVTPNVEIKDIPSDRIDGGATRGANLFHSFQEFNINAGRGAYFSNPAGIANILTRVTGGNPSNIQGVLGVLGKANLFFINPNGIIFGRNARLDLGGSFLGSTANSLIFKNGFEFSATNPQAPPLLTINIPIGLGFRNNPGSITNQSNQPTIVDSRGNPIGLTVPSGNSLVLVGGDINSDNGRITVPGGRVELGGLAGAGTVGLDVTYNTFKLNFGGDSLLSNITLANDARVAVRGNGGGDIVVNANNFTATNGGRLTAGTEGEGNAGDITLNAKNFNFSGVGQSGVGAGVFNDVQPGSTGDGGKINITTGSLSLTDGAEVSASTSGQGNAGNVTINVTGPVTIAGVKDGLSSRIRSFVGTGATGNGGNISISSGSFSLSDRAVLQASTFGQGNAGSVSVRASDSVSLTGSNTGILSTVQAGGVGKGGNIDINAASLSLKDGAQLQTSVLGASNNQPAGRGDAGNVSVDVTGPVTIAGVRDGLPSAIFSDVETGARGNGGNISISSGSFSLSDGAQLIASTFGQGNAGSVSVRASGSVEVVNGDIFSTVGAGGVGKGGNIDIKAASLSLKDGAQLLTTVREASDTQLAGRGDAGNVSVDVTGPVTIAGVRDGLRSAIFSDVETGVIGNGGNINISSGSFSLSDGGRLYASTSGQGNAGSVSVRASGAVELAGSSSAIFSTVEPSGVGNGGNIDIKAASLSLKDGAQLITSVLGASNNQPAGRGDAGNVTVDVTGPVTIAGVKDELPSAIFSRVNTGARGNGGNISISSGSFSLSDGAGLEASTLGQGNAGNVSVRASGGVKLVDAGILSTVEAGGVGNGGNIDIKAASLSLKDSAQLLTLVREKSSTQPAGRGDAGNVTVDVTGPVTIAGVKDGLVSAIFSRVNTGATGNAGNITISSGSFSLSDRAELQARTFGQGNAGNVSVRASGAIELVNASIFSDVGAGGVGKGGNIDIKAASLSLKDGAQLVTAVRRASDNQLAGRGDAGNVTVDVTGPVTIAGVKDEFPSTIFSSVGTGATGNAGNITISSGSFSLSDRAELQARTFGQGNAGNVSVRASGAIELVNASIFSDVGAGGVGKGGNIDIKAATLSLKNGAQLLTVVRPASDTQPDGRGDAGNVTVDVTGNVTIAGVRDGLPSAIFSSLGTGATGNGGNITISSGSLSLSDGGRLSASTSGQGNAGNVSVSVTGFVTIAGVKDGFSSAIFSSVGTGATGNGGNINISSGSLSLSDGGRLSASTSGQGNAGNVSVRASDSVSLTGSNTRIFSTVEAGGVGKGGNIDIKAATLSLKDGAQLRTLVSRASSTQPAGRGDAGNVSVSVTGPVTIAGVGGGVRSGIFSYVDTGATGNGGNINISSGDFSLSDRAQLSASTLGQGNAGSVSVRASDSVELVNAGIFSDVGAEGVGKGGNIDIKAASLSLKDGAQLVTIVREASGNQPAGRGDAGNVTVDVTGPVTIAGVGGGFRSGIFSFVGTGATGNGGNIAISSGSLSLTDSGRLSASTGGQGNAGNVSVRTSSAVELAGSNTGIFSIVEPTGVGKGGNININARTVSLKDGAQITASSTGNGAAGNIEVAARSIRLDNGSIIKADTVAGQGNINLGARDFLLLRRGSKITTNATGLATGGNITINTNNLVAFPRENSDITAKSEESFGGSITINAKGIFGIEYRAQETEFSDITASSALGPQFSGTVQLNTPDVDPSQGLFELSETVIDPAQQIAQNPCIKGFGSSFTIVGRGGVPTDPKEVISSDNVRVDLVKPVTSTVSSTSATKSQPSTSPTTKEIVPAQGWIFNEKGEVMLVAYDPTKTGPQRSSPTPASSCAVR
ncbi:filamentous hemagglutinin N-terminal domain-containing protein [Brasilonema sp. UFV-L1]|uniref:two-partner secretion domain-containing protein n=1 Tax=Brasilonema sp. UFV-L1 TaxID=2234130 RepID=UPI00145F37E1|nr:filamentous hemagglutinin N-terminal domain-containing protein [Brasilonema sp. UFV-L1]NMG08842.1 hypothetical protein [Brasilonema sp. UFV-L1]